jgi:hypothetical protein
MLWAIGLAVLVLPTRSAHAAGVMYLNGPMQQFGGEPAKPDGSFKPAPVPKVGAALPKPPPPKPGEPELSGSFRPSSPQVRTGEGFSPGSSFNDELQRKNRSATGAGLAPMLQFTVPVEN